MTTQVLTASDLRSGGVVFLSEEGGWSSNLSEAWISDNSEIALLLESLGQRAIKKQIIIEPFLIDVNIDNDIPAPVRFREQLRVNGPSINIEFNELPLKAVA